MAERCCMWMHWSFVVLVAVACEGKNSDSAGTAESDVDTDTDSDTDTDTDSDTDVDTGFSAEIQLTVTDPDGTELCDSTIELAGTPFTGYCPAHLCDFAFEVDGVVTAESGTSCDYDDYAKLATYLPTPDYEKRFLAFSSI